MLGDSDVQGIGIFSGRRLRRPFSLRLQETGSRVLSVAAALAPRLTVRQDPQVLGNSQNLLL